jgi:GNAT superfamily N-acetyltransferase
MEAAPQDGETLGPLRVELQGGADAAEGGGGGGGGGGAHKPVELKWLIFAEGKRASLGKLVAEARRDTREAFVKSIFLRPSLRGGGLSLALLEACKHYVRDELGCHALALEAEEDMARYGRLVALYERAGFRVLEGVTTFKMLYSGDETYRVVPMRCGLLGASPAFAAFLFSFSGAARLAEEARSLARMELGVWDALQRLGPPEGALRRAVRFMGFAQDDGQPDWMQCLCLVEGLGRLQREWLWQALEGNSLREAMETDVPAPAPAPAEGTANRAPGLLLPQGGRRVQPPYGNWLASPRCSSTAYLDTLLTPTARRRRARADRDGADPGVVARAVGAPGAAGPRASTPASAGAFGGAGTVLGAAALAAPQAPESGVEGTRPQPQPQQTQPQHAQPEGLEGLQPTWSDDEYLFQVLDRATRGGPQQRCLLPRAALLALRFRDVAGLHEGLYDGALQLEDRRALHWAKLARGLSLRFVGEEAARPEPAARDSARAAHLLVKFFSGAIQW